jgi:hypothetical protein
LLSLSGDGQEKHGFPDAASSNHKVMPGRGDLLNDASLRRSEVLDVLIGCSPDTFREKRKKLLNLVVG